MAAIALVFAVARRHLSRRLPPRTIAAPTRLPQPTPFIPLLPNTAWWWRRKRSSARIGADILRQGGNAIDAAVATGFAMAVTYPRAGNIGGGGFMVIHLRERGQEMAQDIAIDYRETAPAATTQEIFLGSDGKPDNAKSRDSALSIGVPGTVAGLALALEKYGSGKFTLAQLMQPAIALGARRLRPHRRHGRYAARNLPAAGAMARIRKDILPRRRHVVAPGRHADPDRSRGDAHGDRRTGAARILPGAGCGKAGQRRSRRRRHHDRGRSEIISGHHPHAGTRQLSRLRHRLDAAAVFRRHGVAGNTEHPRGLSDAGR